MSSPSPLLARELPVARTTLADPVPGWALLITGLAVAAITGPRWPVPILAWIAPVPFLLFARRIRGWRAWLGLAGVMIAAGCTHAWAITTPPVPVIAVIGFGPPIGLIGLVAVVSGELARRRLGEVVGLFAYAAATVVASWVGYGVTELGAWMSPTTSQVDQLGFLQLAAIAGMAGLGLLMAWCAGIVAMVLGAPRSAWRLAPAISFAAVLGAGLLWAALRLDAPTEGRFVTVAGVTTSLGLDERGMPDDAALAANTDQLFERTRTAAARGARLVVWNEVATVVKPADEPALVSRGQAIARELGIDLVLAYAVLVRTDPLLLDNKYRFIADTGEVLDTYQKHHPVPGEPSIRGTGTLRVLARPYGKVGGAICYDYDFPALAREHARAGAELVVIPSSDWRGIDPVHTLMARLRAIEGGYPIVRAVRWGASAAFDAQGRIVAWMPVTHDELVMVASVPVGHHATPFTTLGDVLVVLAALYLGVILVIGIARRGRRAPLLAVAAVVLGAGCAADLADLVPPTVDEDPALPALELNGTRLHLQTYGTPGDPVIIGLHGGPGYDHRALLPLARLADDGYFVVLWDQRGSGLSRRHACDDVGADAYLGDLEALVDRFAPSGGPPLVLVGHSWGAMYATWYIHAHPERVAGAVLLEPGGFTAGEVEAYFQRLITSSALSEAMGDALWTGRMLTPDDHARADLMASTLFGAAADALGMTEDDPAPAWRAGGVVANCLQTSAGDFDWTPGLDRYPGSVLWLHGDRNTVSTAADQRRLAAAYGNVTVVELEGVGHDLHWVRRDELVARVRAHAEALR